MGSVQSLFREPDYSRYVIHYDDNNELITDISQEIIDKQVSYLEYMKSIKGTPMYKAEKQKQKEKYDAIQKKWLEKSNATLRSIRPRW